MAYQDTVQQAEQARQNAVYDVQVILERSNALVQQINSGGTATADDLENIRQHAEWALAHLNGQADTLAQLRRYNPGVPVAASAARDNAHNGHDHGQEAPNNKSLWARGTNWLKQHNLY